MDGTADTRRGNGPDGSQAGRRRIFMHVGSPKTGTTFLQAILWSQRQRAEDQGLLLPLRSFEEHYLASTDVREKHDDEGFSPRAIGIWKRLVDEGLAWHGNVLVSHELFAAATAEQAANAVRAWGDADVHVIVTARDLERQIPAEWQEHLKHRAAFPFGEFVDALWSKDELAEWFWSVQDYADVCRRWGSAVPPENVHLVTVPRRGSPPAVLWGRFAGLLGLDPEAFDLGSSRSNPSLRAEQAELLRRVNDRLGERLPIPGPYPSVVKDVLAQGILSGRRGARIALHGENRALAAKRSRELVGELEQLGVDVVGDLEELVPLAEPPDELGAVNEHPEAVTDAVLLDESVEALCQLLERINDERGLLDEERGLVAQARQRHESDLDRSRAQLVELRADNDRLLQDMEELRLDVRTRPVRHIAIAASERHRALMSLRVGYWRSVNALRRLSRRGPSS